VTTRGAFGSGHRFADRREAGEALGAALAGRVRPHEALVLGLARGGLPVAWHVARALSAELDILIVRKLGFPGQEELALGAVASGGAQVLNDDVCRAAGITPDRIEAIAARERAEIERRECRYRGGRPAAPIDDRTVILVDDGLATGASMLVAVQAVRARTPRRLIVGVPVGPPETVALVRPAVDELICLEMPPFFVAVGLWYEDFRPVSDEEIVRLLERSLVEPAEAGDAPRP
jgi:putative phosphoribosyl transferase